MERIETASEGENTITWRRTVAGAVYTIKTDRSFQVLEGTTDKAFVYRDHLGSTDVVTDQSGNILQSMSFDPWGQRREASDWSNLSISEIFNFDTDRTNRGYTGHEQLDEVGLIHMNGRVYDPKLARFLQADPFVQSPGNTQSYNRYSYLWNNPLNATDPSGFSLKSLWNEIRPFVGAIVGTVLSVYCNVCGPVVAGMIAGAAGAAANGGDVTGIMMGAIYGGVGGAVFSGIGSQFQGGEGFFAEGGFAHVMAHGVAGGTLSVVQGGKFGHGFASAGFAKAANVNQVMSGDISGSAVATRVTLAAIVGGTASRISGGKFANGAVTAAMAQAFNGERNLKREHDRRAAATLLAATKEMEQTLAATQETHRSLGLGSRNRGCAAGQYGGPCGGLSSDKQGSLSVEGGVAGQVFGGVIGSSVSIVTLGNLTNPDVCLVTTACFQIGLGVYGGAGPAAGAAISLEELTSGAYSTWGPFGSIGFAGASASGSINFGDSSGGKTRGFYGIGKGLAGGLQFCEVSVVCIRN